ncbi:hypothetical protein DL96DRAFT_121742 [Flagelloscypha sp. PMI_526]|nr:hypothetical protein DL96DRAFT_121742 [Flagelloscypha sp. PMI_526]
MSSSSFSRFPDLPLEIQNEIWHDFVGQCRNKEDFVLLYVSRNSRSWAQDRIYHTVSIRTSNALRIVTAVQNNPAPFQEKTRQLELLISSQLPIFIQALEILPIFQSLRRAVLSFSPSAISYSVTHLVLEDGAIRPITPQAVLSHFPHLTHLAVLYFGKTTEAILRAWCDACPSTLYVFLFLDMQIHHSHPGHIQISQPLLLRPVVSTAYFYSHYIRETFPAMWAAAEAALQRAEIEQIDTSYLHIKY